MDGQKHSLFVCLYSIDTNNIYTDTVCLYKSGVRSVISKDEKANSNK